MNRFRWMSMVVLVCAVAAQAEWRALGRVTAVQEVPHGVELTVGAARVRIVALSPTLVRLRYSPDGTIPAEHSFAVLPDAFPSPPMVLVQDSPEGVSLSTGVLQVRILKAPLSILISDRSGRVILQEQRGYPVAFNGKAFRVWMAMPRDEHYFGLGDKAGPIDHREQAYTLWNTDIPGWTQGTDPLYKAIPFFMGVRGGKAYGVFLDNTYRSSFDFGKESRDAFSFGAEGGELDYYFLYGPEPAAVLGAFTTLVGRTPLPPKFVLGFQQSRYSYFPESEVRKIAQGFRDRKIPLDMMYLDIDYEDGYRSFTIDRNRFPNFEGMVHDLGQQGIKLVPIVDLHLNQKPGYRPYDEGRQHDYFVKNPDGSVYVGKVWPGDCVFPDFTRREVREWYGGLYADFMHMGIRGFWNDMNEPAVFRYPEKTMPLDTVHSVEGRKTDHREIHNVFGMENVRATYEGMLRINPDARPYVLTRAAFAGAQRYAATWTGDNVATWAHYRLTVTDLLSMGLSGYPLVGVDEGGFEGDPTPELLTRWTELGTFLPIFRNHSSKGTRQREPWVDGPEHEAIRRQFIETRYHLLPYIYTSMEETSRSGMPLMRPMFLQYPNDPAFTTDDKKFMFGPDLLVAPRVDETINAYEVKLPAGTWYDFWTGKQIESQTLNLNPGLGALPVYVRGGAILPLQAVVQSTDEVPQGPLEVAVYPGPDCRGSLYDDDGRSFAYRKGEFLRVQFSCAVQAGIVKVQIAAPQGTYAPWWKTMKVTVFGVSRKPSQVTVNGTRSADWSFDASQNSVTVTAAGVDEVVVQE